MAKEKKQKEEINEEINNECSVEENVDNEESKKEPNELESKLNEALDKNMRLQAEFVNYKTRTEQEKIIIFLTLYETLLGFKLPHSMANLYRNQRERAEVN